MRAAKVVALALLATLAIWSESTAADTSIDNKEGWHMWQTDEAGPKSRICCFSWRGGASSQKECDLDGGRHSYGNDGNCVAEPGRIRFYALVKDGKPVKIMALSSQCPVTTKTAVFDHGTVPAPASIAWFRRVIEDRSLNQDIREEALFGLVQSESDTAYEYIDSLLVR